VLLVPSIVVCGGGSPDDDDDDNDDDDDVGHLKIFECSLILQEVLEIILFAYCWNNF
jgi:hypothetical protein